MSTDWRFFMIRENYGDDATFSGGSYESELPVTNLQNGDVGVVARTTDLLTASTTVIIDLGSEKQVGGIAICNGNFSINATYQMISSDFSDFSVVKYDSGSKAVPGFVVDPAEYLEWGDPDYWDGVLSHTLLPALPKHAAEIVPTSEWLNATARYWKVVFSDPGNSAGYLEYGFGIIGPGFRASINYGENNATGVTPLSNMSETLGGRRTWFNRGRRRTWQGAFGFLSTRELFSDLFRMSVNILDSLPVFIVPDQSDELHLQNRSFLATVKGPSPVQQLLITDTGSTTLTFEEIL